MFHQFFNKHMAKMISGSIGYAAGVASDHFVIKGNYWKTKDGDLIPPGTSEQVGKDITTGGTLTAISEGESSRQTMEGLKSGKDTTLSSKANNSEGKKPRPS